VLCRKRDTGLPVARPQCVCVCEAIAVRQDAGTDRRMHAATALDVVSAVGNRPLLLHGVQQKYTTELAMFNSVVYFCCTSWSNRGRVPSADMTPKLVVARAGMRSPMSPPTNPTAHAARVGPIAGALSKHTWIAFSH
jgi:hypothetical protein